MTRAAEATAAVIVRNHAAPGLSKSDRTGAARGANKVHKPIFL